MKFNFGSFMKKNKMTFIYCGIAAVVIMVVFWVKKLLLPANSPMEDTIKEEQKQAVETGKKIMANGYSYNAFCDILISAQFSGLLFPRSFNTDEVYLGSLCQKIKTYEMPDLEQVYQERKRATFYVWQIDWAGTFQQDCRRTFNASELKTYCNHLFQ